MTAAASDTAELLALVARGDRAAFSELYRATAPKLFGVVSRILPAGEASEVLQEAFVKIWERASEFDRAKGAPLAWMTTIARNRALDEKRRARPTSLEDMPEGFEPAAEFLHPLDGRERDEALGALTRCLDGLEPERRNMIVLAYCHGASREALADKFGTPVGTVKTRLRRALAQLKDCLSS